MALSVTKHIYKQLSESEALTSIVGDRIYPTNILHGAPAFPFVVFDTQTGAPEYDKDGIVTDNHTITVYIVAREYMTELLPAAEAVRSALELVTAEYDTFSVISSMFEGGFDGWDEVLQSLAYTLTFSVETESNV